MADVKISELTAQASANVDISADVLALVDTSVPQTKKISVENLLSPITIDKSAGTITSLGTVTGNVDFNADLDVDGVTNLDVVDIDGAVDMASTLAIGDAVTVTKAISGSSGDNFLLNIIGTEASGTDLVVGDNVGILFKTAYETTTSKIGSAIVATRESADDTISSTGLAFKVSQNDETLDTALTIDSSQNATFAGDVTLLGASSYARDLTFAHGATNYYWRMGYTDTSNGNTLAFINRDGGSEQEVMRMDYNKLTTFAGSITSGTHLIDGVSNYTGLEVKGSGGSRPQVKFTNVNNGTLGAIYGTEGNALIIGTGSSNTTALTLDSSQRVGIGETNPAYKLDLASSEAIVSQFTGSSGETILSLDNTSTNGDKWYLISGGSSGSFSGGKFGIYNADTSTAVATFTNDGKVGVGTTFGENIASSINKFAVRSDTSGTHYNMVNIWEHDNTTANIEQRIGWAFGDDGGNEASFGFAGYIGIGKQDAWSVDSNRDAYMAFGVAENNSVVERMSIKSSGQIETNYGDSSYNLYINGLASSGTKGILIAVGGSSGTVDQMLFRDGNSHNCGAITSDASANTTNYGGTSDYRLKENEEIIPDGLKRLNRLKPYRFNFISAPKQTQDGFFAHELAEHIPEAVVGTKDEMEDVLYEAGDDIPEGNNVGDVKETVIKPQMVDYAKITPLLVKALQEADDKIDALTARIEALENA